MRPKIRIVGLLLLLASAVVFGCHAAFPRPSKFSEFPRVTLWAWERPEDLRSLDPHLYAVAYLDQTILIGDRVSSVPRFQPLQLASSAKVIAVVRVEAPRLSARVDAAGVVSKVAVLVASSARKPGVAALQIDFDATELQREFYKEVIRAVRQQMPRGMPLSITALVSWCGRDDWLQGLPIDEAVPMFFRMGGYPHSSGNLQLQYSIREPLCSATVGVSTDEAWPRIFTTQRVYLFHPRPWDELAVKNAGKLLAP